jgi:hypothetical protein
MWIKTVPTESGLYWTATRDGLFAGMQRVVWGNGECIFAGNKNKDMFWAGWWWSIPIEPPPPVRKNWDE